MTAPTDPVPHTPPDTMTGAIVRRSKTPGTVVVLILCALLAGGAVFAAMVLPGFARDGVRRDAETTLRAFLDGTVAGGDDWQDDAGPLLQSVSSEGAPLIGEERTADALELSARYEVGDLSFNRSVLADSDTASAPVVVRYGYRVLGEKGSASIPQTVWMTRPFYYGDDVPQRADPKRTPTAVGPWRVVGITLPSGGSVEGSAPRSTFELSSDARSADDTACHSPAKALTQLADRARIDGVLTSSCFAGAEDGSDVVAAGVDTTELIAAFPAIDESDPASMPPELTRVEADLFRSMRAPFTQYLVEDTYVLTFAAVRTDDDEDATRLVRIEQIEAAR